MPYLKCREGDVVFIRAVVLEACSDAFQVRVEDYPQRVMTFWVPAREIARREDIGLMPPMRRYDGKYLYAEESAPTLDPRPKR